MYIGRPSEWGNPYIIGTHATTRAAVLAKFEKYLRDDPELVARVKQELKGRDLECWCAPKPCHGDLLLRVANEE